LTSLLPLEELFSSHLKNAERICYSRLALTMLDPVPENFPFLLPTVDCNHQPPPLPSNRVLDGFGFVFLFFFSISLQKKMTFSFVSAPFSVLHQHFGASLFSSLWSKKSPILHFFFLPPSLDIKEGRILVYFFLLPSPFFIKAD